LKAEEDKKVQHFNCSMDKRTSKDTFHSTFGKLASPTSKNNLFKSSNIKTDEGDQVLDGVLLRLDVNIDDTNRIEKLEILANQKVEDAINDFCLKFGISDIKKERLQKIVEERLLSLKNSDNKI